MARRPKTERVPRTRAGGEWTEAAYWGFIRSHLRLMSRRWPARKQAMERVKRPSQSDNKRLKWEYQCEHCGEWMAGKDMSVDHITPCGKLLSFDDVGEFIRRLLCEAEGLQVLCETCHSLKTKKESVG